MSTRVFIKRREFRRAADSFVAASVQEVGEERGDDGQGGDAEGSHKLDRSRLGIHLFVGWLVRVKRQVNLGCCGDGRDGLAPIDGTCGSHCVGWCRPAQLCSGLNLDREDRRTQIWYDPNGTTTREMWNFVCC